MIELSNEDDFRLNILLTEPLHAVRIDENKMVLHALLERGELQFPLNPNCPPTRYLKRVREFLSSHALGSPGGYPVYLQRWARMGQIRGDTLAGLLCIAEPEAVIAAAHTPALTLELAKRAWWALPIAEVARQLLRRNDFANSDLGPVLAAFLIDDLPFEQESRLVVESVRLLLQPGLLRDEVRLSLWKGAQRHGGYLTGFIKAIPDDLPHPRNAHPEAAQYATVLAPLLAQRHRYARLVCRLLSAPGQHFMHELMRAINIVGDQDTVVSLFEGIADYFKMHDGEIDTAQACLALCPDIQPLLTAIQALEKYNADSLNEVLGRTDAVGSVMRRKLDTVTKPLLEQLQTLLTVHAHG